MKYRYGTFRALDGFSEVSSTEDIRLAKHEAELLYWKLKEDMKAGTVKRYTCSVVLDEEDEIIAQYGVK